MITTIAPKSACCGNTEPENVARPYPHTHDDRYFTKTEINLKIEGINKVLIGTGMPTQDIGTIGDLYINQFHLRKPIYRKQAGETEEEDDWVFITNLNEVDPEILEATQEV